MNNAKILEIKANSIELTEQEKEEMSKQNIGAIPRMLVIYEDKLEAEVKK